MDQKKTGFSSTRKYQILRIKGGRHDQTDKHGKQSLEFGNNEVIDDICNRSFSDVLQITAFEE